MFESFEMAPADPILGLTETFRNDPNPKKVNLSVGVYKDAKGRTPVLATVKKAERRLVEEEASKGYLPIDGSPAYAAAVQELVFGAGHEVIASKRAATAHCPGGTCALRVAAEFIHEMIPGARVWMSDPTWPNHNNIFQAAGVELKTYPYYDAKNKSLAFDALAAALEEIPRGDVVLLHGCCHNPSGMDPTPAQWAQLAEILRRRGLLPFFDFAYQGLADGLREDARGVLEFCVPGAELLIASSFSKNFGLYNERVGALTLVAASADGAKKAQSHVKRLVRANYSNPPSHGGAVVATILGDAALRAEWEGEVAEIRERINAMRRLFVERLKAAGVERDFSFITRQRGMFSFSGLTRPQVDYLKEKYAIYIVGSGRINVAGMTQDNMDYICAAIADALASK